MPTDTIAGLFAAAAGFTWPLAGKGIILAGTTEKQTPDAGDGGTITVNLAGSTLAISPTVGKGPVYVSDSNFPDPAATATSSRGWGGFADLPPGEYVVTAARSGMTCTKSFYGWPAANPSSARIPAIADFIVSSVDFSCK